MRFSQKIHRIEMKSCVDLPPDLSASLDQKNSVPVKGTLNDTPLRGTLIPLDGGRHRFFIHERVQQEAKVKVGDLVTLDLEIETESRDPLMSPELEEALEASPQARMRWNAFPLPTQQKILKYLNYQQTPAALREEIKKLLFKLKEVP